MNKPDIDATGGGNATRGVSTAEVDNEAGNKILNWISPLMKYKTNCDLSRSEYRIHTVSLILT